MEPALKQRLIGAAVLVALAVIFLPMLIKGPAPESGISDVPLEPPAAPQDGDFETRELPLVEPGTAPAGGALGMPVEREAEPAVADPASANSDAGAAGGDWAVSFGSYATAQDAQRVVDALAKSQLRSYHEPYTSANGRELHRVRIGPFATRAEAEASRVRAAAIRSDVRVQVVALNAQAAEPASGTQPAVAAEVSKPEPLPPETKPAETTKPANENPVADNPAPQKPAATTPATKPEPAKPAASDVGFAVQVGAFSDPAEAERMRTRLRAAGFTAFTETVRTDRGTLNRVRVGPVGTREEADQLKAQLVTKAGVDGIVRPHP